MKEKKMELGYFVVQFMVVMENKKDRNRLGLLF